ncbi:MAG: hypothetical protein ACSLFF_07450 [Solirubrobacterales bacterium]
MSSRSTISVLFIAIAAIASVFALVSSSDARGGKVQTLRLFEKSVSVSIAHADGTTVSKPPYPRPAAGDTLIATSRDFVGNHKKHAKAWTGSSRTICKFIAADAPPTCTSTVAIGGSLLVFEGDRGTLIDGTGVYEGATGRTLSNKTIGDSNDSDVVVKITLK